VALMLHARRLIAPRTRRGIARTLHGMVAAAQRRAVVPAGPVGLGVARAAPELLALADRLERPGAVDARGVALVRELLRDGLGPLYAERRDAPLAAAAREATAALEPLS
jgi:NADPH-dependent 2,4-dienoyl-CoA reductase/sulfur reductase-like enzyme